jgi:hypothetical protein
MIQPVQEYQYGMEYHDGGPAGCLRDHRRQVVD